VFFTAELRTALDAGAARGVTGAAMTGAAATAAAGAGASGTIMRE
jgi:hypothetical protein